MILDDCNLMPQMGSAHIYPGGFPMNTDRLAVEGKTMMQRIAEYYKSGMEKPEYTMTEDDTDILAQFICYYWNAPIWRGIIPKEVVESVKALQPTLESINDHLGTCIDYGLDPL